MVLRRLFCGKMVKLENAAPRCAASICCRALASARFPPNGHPECPWLATLQDAWARAMFCWQRGKLAGDECLRVAVSDVRLSAIIASEAAARGKRPPPPRRSWGDKTTALTVFESCSMCFWTSGLMWVYCRGHRLKKAHAVIVGEAKVWSGPGGGLNRGQNGIKIWIIFVLGGCFWLRMWQHVIFNPPDADSQCCLPRNMRSFDVSL